jgi:acyl-CoA reductase-like NAD-dependent aldehyde dehydrogenase
MQIITVFRSVSVSFDETALKLADDTEYGLQASVFTKELDCLFKAIRHLQNRHVREKGQILEHVAERPLLWEGN